MKKIIIVILLILSGFLFLFVFNKEEIKIYLPKKFSFIAKYVPEEILILKNMIPGNRWIKHYKMDYNVKFLPETQFLNLNLKTTREIDFISKNWFYPFYIEIFKNVIIIIDTKGKMGSIDISNFDINKIKNLEVKKIKNNIKVDNVLSSLVIDDEIYISVVIFKNDCQYLKVMKAKINLDKINNKCINIINVDFKFSKPFEKISDRSNDYINECFEKSIYLLNKGFFSGMINFKILFSVIKTFYLFCTVEANLACTAWIIFCLRWIYCYAIMI